MRKVSLLIPCYNSSKYLPRLWKTIESQTVKFDEVICYDDCSEDDTINVAKNLGSKVIIGTERKGPGFARNQLAKEARYGWIHFHDSDDVLDKCYLEKKKDYINDDVDAIVCNADWIDEITKKSIITWKYNKNELENNPVKATIMNPIGINSLLLRKDNFFKVDGFEERLRCWEDADLSVRLAASSTRFTLIDEILTISYRREGSLSSDQHYCWKCRLEFLKKYATIFDNPLYEIIAEQAEDAAKILLEFSDYENAKEAILFCKSLGASPPSTNNIIIKSLKHVLPSFWLLRFQIYLRNLRNSLNLI